MPKIQEAIKLKITVKIIPLIEKALDIKLYEPQKEYLVNDGSYWYGDRNSGKTLAYCIKLALINDKPLDMRRPEDYCDPDYGPENNKRCYTNSYFKRMLLDVRQRLKDSGFKVIEIRI